jgi:hypothetical protein
MGLELRPRPHAHHDQRLLHAKDGIAREEFIAFGVQRRDELAETWGVDHHVKMIRPDIMSSQCEKQVTNRTLKKGDERNDTETLTL